MVVKNKKEYRTRFNDMGPDTIFATLRHAPLSAAKTALLKRCLAILSGHVAHAELAEDIRSVLSREDLARELAVRNGDEES